MRRLTLVPAAALALTAALAVTAALTASAAAGDQRISLGGGVSIALPAGWHLTRGRGTPVRVPIPRLAAATFAVRWSRRHCVCETPRLSRLPRTGALLFVREYPRIARRDYGAFPRPSSRVRIRGGTVTEDGCVPSDTVAFRVGHRGFEAEIYLGPEAPASVRTQIAAILDSWRVS